ncbi:MAG: PIN domain-containing protein [Bacteroidales bacterium]|nr:PIN domain-containing protein [Bacteroidales bacterium]
MRRVFLDTNILIDLAMERQCRSEAEMIWELADNSAIDIFATTLSYANAAYVMRRLPLDERYARLYALTKGISIVPLSKEHITAAIAHPTKDFEDMLQYQCARAADCEVIVTNNAKDFTEFCTLPIMTSSEFLTSFISQNS